MIAQPAMLYGMATVPVTIDPTRRTGSDRDEDSVLASMCRWFAINKLSLNVLKTSYMLFRNNTAIDTELSINGVCLERVRVAKFLGVLIDEHLNWKPHIARVQSKLSKTTAILYKCSPDPLSSE